MFAGIYKRVRAVVCPCFPRRNRVHPIVIIVETMATESCAERQKVKEDLKVLEASVQNDNTQTSGSVKIGEDRLENNSGSIVVLPYSTTTLNTGSRQYHDTITGTYTEKQGKTGISANGHPSTLERRVDSFDRPKYRPLAGGNGTRVNAGVGTRHDTVTGMARPLYRPGVGKEATTYMRSESRKVDIALVQQEREKGRALPVLFYGGVPQTRNQVSRSKEDEALDRWAKEQLQKERKG